MEVEECGGKEVGTMNECLGKTLWILFDTNFSGPSPFINLLYKGKSLRLDMQSLSIYGVYSIF
jgi:hypothetical protein